MEYWPMVERWRWSLVVSGSMKYSIWCLAPDSSGLHRGDGSLRLITRLSRTLDIIGRSWCDLITTLLHATAVGGRSGGRILLRTSAVLTTFLTLP